MAMMRSAVMAAGLLAFLPAPAKANDTQAALGLGGLIFERSDEIAMESEDLYLSHDKVRVRYTYRNLTSKPVTILVAFPLPDVPVDGRDLEWIESAYPDWDAIGMTTKVDGKQVELLRIDVPKLGGKDISARLKERGWPVRYWQDEGFHARLSALSADDKSELVGEGLLSADQLTGHELRPLWTVSTAFVRTQTFPPGKAVTVEHAYEPMIGGTVTSALDREARDENMAGPDGYEARYCVDGPFLRGYDRRRYTADGGRIETVMPVETWLSYVLATGANWKGPIKRFKLTVDKPGPQVLVSLCMDGLTRVSPTRFEVEKTDFEPTRDIDILFLEVVSSDGGS